MRLLFLLFFIISSLTLLCCSEAESTTESLPLLVFTDAGFVESDLDQEAQIKIELSKPSLSEVVINYEAKSGTALPEQDYDLLQINKVSFAPGETEQSISFEIIGDETEESDEVFYLLFSTADNADILNTEMTIHITNDDFDSVALRTIELSDSGYQTPLVYEGMSLVWQDEFDQSMINSQNWTFEIGDGCPDLCGWGNRELQYYTEENTYLVNNNYLVIEAKKESMEESSYTSSRLVTKNKKSFKYGRIDIRAKLPLGQGIWPALWMLGNNIDQVSWPKCGEIDIMEMIGGGDGRDNTVHGTAHWWDNEFRAQYGNSSELSEGIYNDEFHVFSIVWDATKISWYRDDKLFNTLDITPFFLAEFKESFFLILNVAVGGNWPGNPNSITEFPQYMIVDYVRVFQKE